MSLPHKDDFDTRPAGSPGLYFEDVAGTFVVSEGTLEQLVPTRPNEWEHNSEPLTVVGDQRWVAGKVMSTWQDYEVEVSGRVLTHAAPAPT